ncbi:MAG: hypothetical protein FWF29_08305 [Treponema sp.]|nr:hypothetical protein [Treponema sp.]
MTFIDAICAPLILGLFLAGLSQISLPAYRAWDRATAEYGTAKAIHFIAESFRNECVKSDRNIENWRNKVAATKELESCDISEIRQGDVLCALKAVCVISGERVEIIGVCTP